MTDRDRILLVALADGTLRGRRRARAEALVRALPDGPELLERQRRVRSVLLVPEPPRPRRSRAPRVVPAVAALLLLAMLVPQFRDRPVVAQAADLSQRPATAPADLSAGVDGLAFPDWGREFGWNEIGSRRDTLGGRVTKTVFYEHKGHRLAYTILPGPPERPTGEARIVRRNGVEIAISHDPRHGGHDVAVFERDGRTCVIAGHVERVSTLIELAASDR
jgi:hypothetical protein